MGEMFLRDHPQEPHERPVRWLSGQHANAASLRRCLMGKLGSDARTGRARRFVWFPRRLLEPIAHSCLIEPQEMLGLAAKISRRSGHQVFSDFSSTRRIRIILIVRIPVSLHVRRRGRARSRLWFRRAVCVDDDGDEIEEDSDRS